MSLDELNDLQRYLVEEEAEHLEEGSITRREFIRRITLLFGGIVAAGPILLAYGCGPDEATATPAPTPSATTAPPPATAGPPTATTAAATATTEAAPATATTAAPATATGSAAGPANQSPFHVDENDPSVSAQSVTFPAADAGGPLMGYLATPAGASGKLAGVLVIHENRGLTAHILDVVRRVAKAGYVALGVDLLSRQGGTAALTDDAARTAGLGQMSPDQLVSDLSAGLDFLKAHNLVDPARLGVTGFCFGGGLTWRMATKRADLKAALPYYGPNPPLADVPNIKAAVLAHYGGNDSRINAGIPQLEEALKAAGITYQIKIYPGANHAFNNDTGANYNAEAAQTAWEQTLAWFRSYLG